MTGPEHYREAEKYIASAQKKAHYTDGNGVSHEELALLRYAQVHATLAAAAATAIPNLRRDYPANEDEWYKLAAVPEPQS